MRIRLYISLLLVFFLFPFGIRVEAIGYDDVDGDNKYPYQEKLDEFNYNKSVIDQYNYNRIKECVEGPNVNEEDCGTEIIFGDSGDKGKILYNVMYKDINYLTIKLENLLKNNAISEKEYYVELYNIISNYEQTTDYADSFFNNQCDQNNLIITCNNLKQIIGIYKLNIENFKTDLLKYDELKKGNSGISSVMDSYLLNLYKMATINDISEVFNIMNKMDSTANAFGNDYDEINNIYKQILNRLDSEKSNYLENEKKIGVVGEFEKNAIKEIESYLLKMNMDEEERNLLIPGQVIKLSSNESGSDGGGGGASCEEILGPTLVTVIKNIFNGLKFFAPIFAIILTIVDFSKAVLSTDKDQLTKALSNTVKRFIFVVALYLLPHLIDIILSFITQATFKSCKIS